MSSKNGTFGSAKRAKLAGESARSGEGAGDVGDHGQVSPAREAARRFMATSSLGGTLPAESRWMCPATRAEAPRTPNRSFRTASAEIPATAATSASVSPSARIQSPSRTLGLPTTAPVAPAVLTPARLSEVLAVILQEVVAMIPTVDRDIALERLANRLDGFGRTAGSGDGAAMLGAVSGALMRLEG